MKKLIVSFIFLLALGIISAEENKFSLSIGAGTRNVKGVENENGINLYNEVYGKNNMLYSIDLGYQVSKSLQVFLHYDSFSVDGKLTYTEEDTKLTIKPLELGLRFFMGKRLIFPYIGAGTGYYMYKEENVIGTMDEKKFSFFSEGGLQFRFTPLLFLDLKVKYIFLKVDGPEAQVDLGGWALIGGIGISF
jgi:opacity protein-like surface antigen